MTTPSDPSSYRVLDPRGRRYGSWNLLRAWLSGDRIQAVLRVDRQADWPFEAILPASPFKLRPVFESACRRNFSHLGSPVQRIDRLPPEVHVPFPSAWKRLARLLRGKPPAWSIERLLSDPLHLGTARTTPILSAKGIDRADPFPFHQDGVDWILFEEKVRGDRGRLRAARRDDLNWDVLPGEMLPLPHHLSWPNVFQHDGNIFLVPEAGESKEVALWECAQFPDQWTKRRILLSGRPWLDPCLLFHDNLWWLFVSPGGDHPSDHSSELCIFYSSSLLDGTFQPHPLNPVSLSVAGSRPAGHLFMHQGAWIRPTQDCRAGYGTGILLRRLETLTTSEFRETTLGRIAPPHGASGIHTLNRQRDGQWLVDVMR